MFDTHIIITIFVTFFVAGAVKGIVGLGLPTICLAVLTVAIDLPSAMALLLVPTFFTNVWQALVGGHLMTVLQRLWPFLLMAAFTVWIGAMALTRFDLDLLSALLGGLIIAYALVNLFGWRFSVSRRHEPWVGALLGTVNGILTGMTGSFVVPGVMFMQSIGLSRDVLIQAMGMLFMVSTLALGAALQQNALLATGQGVWSVVALVPAILGMTAGRKIRQGMPEERFRKIFFISLLTLGTYIVMRAGFSLY